MLVAKTAHEAESRASQRFSKFGLNLAEPALIRIPSRASRLRIGDHGTQDIHILIAHFGTEHEIERLLSQFGVGEKTDRGEGRIVFPGCPRFLQSISALLVKIRIAIACRN